MLKTVFAEEILSLKNGKYNSIAKGSLMSLHPLLDEHGILRVGGRGDHSKLPYTHCHPTTLPKNHTLTKLIVRSEHTCLLHAGPTLVSASLSHQFHIIGFRLVIRPITRACVVCRGLSGRAVSGLPIRK